MKIVYFKVLCIALLFVFTGCDDMVRDDEHTLTEAIYTGPNTARIIYKSIEWGDWNLTSGSVHIYNVTFEKEYFITHETRAENVDTNRYAVDITVRPDWEPGDLVTVSGGGYYFGSVHFNVPE